ncbi:MAG: I78 family peptidase inhibitor [Pseudomonadota bacterium]
MLRLFVLPFALLTACAAESVDAPPDDSCGAPVLSHLVGQDMSALAAMTFPDTTRFIAPDTAITMDFSPTRLNFDLDDAGVITRVWCG